MGSISVYNESLPSHMRFGACLASLTWRVDIGLLLTICRTICRRPIPRTWFDCLVGDSGDFGCGSRAWTGCVTMGFKFQCACATSSLAELCAIGVRYTPSTVSSFSTKIQQVETEDDQT